MADNIKGKVHYRPATSKDVPGILWLIQLLAEDEFEPNALKIGQKELLRDGFGTESWFKVILAELDSAPVCEASPDATPSHPLPPSASMEKNEQLVGYALYFFNYSTWEGRVLYLEDVYVRKEYRNQGYGTVLMKECAKVAVEKDCARMVWQVLDWNTKALNLYERVGGVCLKEWLTVRMIRPNILQFAS